MGAGFSVKCPEPFVKADAFTCVMPCPADKKFLRTNDNGTYKCVYGPDNTKFVTLVTVGGVPITADNAQGSSETLTIEGLQTQGLTQEARAFASEKDRFEKEIAVVYANIDKQQKIDDAFRDLQNAENARDESPEAYQAARTAYYTLIKGDGWLAEERERVAKAEVTPEVQKYRDNLSAVNLRKQKQEKTIDVVKGLKDKVLTLKDDFKYSVNTFSDQLEKVKIQLNMENRTREREKDNTWAWIDTILNVLLVGVLLYAIYTFVRRYFLHQRPVVPTTTIRIPTYTGQPIYR